MLTFANLALRRGTLLLFSDVSFTIHKGRKVGLIGANGAGKSSTLMSIAGHVKIQEGKVFYKNNELNQIQNKR